MIVMKTWVGQLMIWWMMIMNKLSLVKNENQVYLPDSLYLKNLGRL